MELFSPSTATVNVTVVSTAGGASVKVAASQRGKIQVRYHNDSGATAFIAWGGASVSASTSACMSIPNGNVGGITVMAPLNDDLYFAVIGSGTGKFYLTPGSGI
jgi:hypothetical protein